jgi:RNA polymerase sigma-70 factor (ECF subfamily)
LTYHKTKDELLKELQIIERAKQDPKAFGVLYERYYHEIFVFINKKTDDMNISGDIASHVFYKALQNIKKYTYKGVPFSAWLYRIASNETNLYFRKNKNQRAISIETEGVEKMISLFEPSEERDIQPVIEAIAKLKPQEVELIELRFFEKLSFRDIAYILNTTENNAKVKTFRIIKRIRKIMGINE